MPYSTQSYFISAIDGKIRLASASVLSAIDLRAIARSFSDDVIHFWTHTQESLL